MIIYLEANDYSLVTYYDLLYSKRLIRNIKGKEYEKNEIMLEAKIDYLKDNNIDSKVNVAQIENKIGLIE